MTLGSHNARELDELSTPAVEEGIVTDEKGIGFRTRKRCESRIDLGNGAGFEDLDLQPHGMS
jgi:hypothetical protein